MIAKEKLKLMLPANRVRVEAADKALDEARKSDAERREMFVASTASPEAAMEYAAGRMLRINTDIDADLLATQLFRTDVLQDNEWPELYNEANQQYEVKEISQLGGVPKDSFLNADEVNTYNPYIVSSDLIKYPIQSAVTGKLTITDRVNKRVAYSIAKKINKDVWTLIKSIYGTFPTGTFNTDPDVVSFPTSNSIDSSAQGSITINTMKSLLALSLQLGIKIDKVYVSPLTLPDVWDWVSLYNAGGSAGGYNAEVPEATQEKILTSGVVNNLFGYNITWITDNTLEADRMYCFSDQPVGVYSVKPSQDKVLRYNEKEVQAMEHVMNQEAVLSRKTIHLLIPAYYRKNTIRVITA